MAKSGIQPITTAALAAPKIKSNIPGIAKPMKMAKPPKSTTMSALFGKKATKPAIQSTPTKVPAF